MDHYYLRWGHNLWKGLPGPPGLYRLGFTGLCGFVNRVYTGRLRGLCHPGRDRLPPRGRIGRCLRPYQTLQKGCLGIPGPGCRFGTGYFFFPILNGGSLGSQIDEERSKL